MHNTNPRQSSTAHSPSPETPPARPPRVWHKRLPLMLGSVVLLWMAFAPFGQFYLAWIGLVPWLLLIRGTRSPWSALFWGWLSGFAFFTANVWWLWKATIPGALGLVAYLPMDWAAAGMIIHMLGLLGPDGFVLRPNTAKEQSPLEGNWRRRSLRIGAAILLIAMTWTGAEWLRLTITKAFAWMPIGYSQTPALAMCQVADALGVSGITFWVLLINAFFAMLVIHRAHLRRLIPAAVMVTAALAITLGYGVFRMSQRATEPGPIVMVVQSNYPHLRGGAPTVSREDKAAWHLETTRASLQTQRPDLVVWSETVAPPLNEEARRELQRTEAGRFMEATHHAISRLTAEAGVSLATGGFHVGGWTQDGTARVAKEIRSCVYLYDCHGQQSRDRYDKTDLVLYSERMPFPSAPAWAHRLLMRLAASVAAQPLTPGDPNALTVFTLPARNAPDHTATAGTGPYRFATPICLENINPRLISRMVVGTDGRKRADFLTNHSNDGWFNDIERAQHLQAVRLRCIENRVPMARSSNTGISAMIDSLGRITHSMPAGLSGVSTARLAIDKRVTVFARHGNVFAAGCALGCGMMVLVMLVRRIAG